MCMCRHGRERKWSWRSKSSLVSMEWFPFRMDPPGLAPSHLDGSASSQGREWESPRKRSNISLTSLSILHNYTTTTFSTTSREFCSVFLPLISPCISWADKNFSAASCCLRRGKIAQPALGQSCCHVVLPENWLHYLSLMETCTRERRGELLYINVAIYTIPT